jgi:hypothetical protein
MAWARRHGVRPPGFAIAKARAAGINLAWLDGSSDRAKPKVNCCVAQSYADKTCCAAELVAAVPAIAKRSCCSESQDVTSQYESAPANTSNHVVGWRALACHGQSLHWLAAVPTLIVPPRELLNDLSLVERRAPTSSEVAEGLSDSPDVPPPKVA